MKTRHLMALSALVVVVGCGDKKAPSTVAQNDVQQMPPVEGPSGVTPETPAQPPATAGEPGKAANPEPTRDPNAPVKPTSSEGVRQQPRYEIVGAQTDGWHKSDISAVELGRRLDEAASKLTAATGDARFDMIDGDKKGWMQIKVLVANPGRLRFEYVLPSEPEILNNITVLDGKWRMFEHGKILERRAPTSSPPVDPKQLAQRWSEAFPRYLMGSLVDRRPTWGPLLEALSKGEGGFQTVVETKQMPVRGEKRDFYRVLAQRKGDDAAMVEMRFDGYRYLPLTVRVHSTPKGKPARQMQWMGGWAFGKPITDEDLQPEKKKSRLAAPRTPG